MTSSIIATPLAAVDGFSHVRLTVTDIAASKKFYSALLGTDPAADFSDQTDPDVKTDPARLYGGCAFDLGGQLLGLRPVAASGDRFDSVRVGLDHVSLSVASVDQLHKAVTRLDQAGVTHGEVTPLDDLGMAIVSLQDPDDINLELAAPLDSPDAGGH